jgi:hypothetical protein
MVGEDRTVGAVVGWGCTNVCAGNLKQTSEGTFNIGLLNGEITPEIEQIKTMLETFTTTTISTNIMGHLWTKLLINCAVAPVGVSFGAEVKDLVNNRELLPIMIGLTNELITVALASDVKLEKFENLLDVDLLQVQTFEDYKRAVAILKIVGEKHKSIKSTIWQDIEKGRKTEIDYLNGFIERKAEENGISTPINQALINLVKQIEKGEKQPSIDNLEYFYNQVRIPKKWIEYDYHADPTHDLNLFILPDNQKQQQAADLTAAHTLGLTIAFSKAFDKITHSIIGKLFIRKTTWEISRLVLSGFFHEMGKTFAKNVISAYQIKKTDVSAVTKIAIFYLANLNIDYSIKKMTSNETEMQIFGDTDPFIKTAEMLSIDTKIPLPFFKPFFKGIADHVDSTILITCNEEDVTDKKIYKTIIRKS